MKGFLNFLSKYVLISVFFLITATGCWDMHSHEPLMTNIDGTWRWTKTFDKKYNVTESSSAINSAHIQFKYMPYGSGFLNAMEFYNNDVKVDSLYMPSTDNYGSSIVNGNEVIVNYVDGQKKPAVARFKFFFPKNKSSANRMELSIQKNTSKYKPEMDTLIKEYFRDFM